MASAAKSTGSNRLAFEKSPYLLQHQNNPVDWYPWSNEAFEAARSKNLPIFLSVGYSTCHWCHVMERESFENEEIADILNANFISIKVDREERPDVDKLYMSFIQALSGHGGWPMTVFLTPNLEPITGGTYFPPKDSMGRPGFASILRMISKGWNSNQADMVEQGKNIIMALNESAATTSVDDLPPIDSAINHAYQYYDKRFDNVHGGFGGAPKFPKPVDLEYLLNYSQWEKDNPRSQNAVDMLRLTLDKIAQGGIHDHIGKGFHRYSVDGEWHVPHFEKMLYDQAQLLSVYSDYHLLTGRHQEVVRDIVDYMTTDLKHPEGGFYTAEDADSLPQRDSEEKREGAFCVWEHHDVVRALEDRFVGEVPLADIFCDYFDIRPEGNVPKEIDAHNELSNQNVLRVRHTVTDLAVRFGIEERLVKPAIEEAKKVLAGIRSNRPPPHLDSKMVASLQGLAISGLAKASVSLKEPSYRLLAEEAAEFVRRYMIDDGDSLLRAVYRAEDGGITQGQQDIGAFSDDYAELIQGLLDLYQVNGDSSLLRWAYELQADMNEKFWDSTNNAGYFIGGANGDVAVRMMEDQDGAEPCANSVAACNLVRFWALLGSEECRNKAMQIMTASALKLQKYPYIIPKTVLAYKQLADGFNKIVLVAHSLVHDENSTSNFKAQILGHYRCNLHLLELDPTADNAWLLSMCPEYGDMLSAPVPSVFICRGTQCSLPIRDADKLAEALKEL